MKKGNANERKGNNLPAAGDSRLICTVVAQIGLYCEAASEGGFNKNKLHSLCRKYLGRL